ncbi:hypothetical protein E2320_012413 [Naja naja]|nr:hypothetical protein E2320_012413 [Naja naja]
MERRAAAGQELQFSKKRVGVQLRHRPWGALTLQPNPGTSPRCLPPARLRGLFDAARCQTPRLQAVAPAGAAAELQQLLSGRRRSSSLSLRWVLCNAYGELPAARAGAARAAAARVPGPRRVRGGGLAALCLLRCGGRAGPGPRFARARVERRSPRKGF